MAKGRPRQGSPPPSSSPSETSSESGSSSSGSDVNDSENDVSSSSGASEEEETVNVDFEFFDPSPEDFDGVKALLKSYLEDEAWDPSELVNICLAQTTVGTVLKTSEDENPIGVLTVLNLARYKDQRSMHDIHRYLLENCCVKSVRERLEAIWNQHAEHVGLLISERLANVPFDLVPPLYSGLLDEIMWATEDEPTEELQKYFRLLKEYLIVTRVFLDRPTRSLPDNEHAKGAYNKEEGELIFVKPEDEVFHRLCTWSFSFPVKAEAEAAHETETLKQLRLVMGVQAKHMDAFKTAISKML
ncbi:hypothetical protein R1flu_006800 [Riccia fluitans]|uniref:Protein BCCIP homolog n=1 Tax=Riccia fluitans TaxID=41844 RepID=A0ABD1YX24_9MARC